MGRPAPAESGVGVCWGAPQAGGECPGTDGEPMRFAPGTTVFHTESAFLALDMASGRGRCWGDPLAGGDCDFVDLHRTTRVFTRNDEDPLPDANLIARHRLAGRLGIGGTVLGFISAGFVLAGMYQRLG